MYTIKKQTGAERRDQEAQAQTFGLLEGQPKVRVLLPRDPQDKGNSPLVVRINGAVYPVPRGVSAEIPQDVAALLTDAGML
ncbi:MAG: hypothetical protein LBU67_09570 [Oscillospiraceae bacterium]|jgi:hypothetical protein|nr:hypothetical protein [Oscillospiraceae bacterium]